MVPACAAFVLGPIASATVHGLLSPRRELTADADAAELCESPHGLADALLRLEQANELVAFAGNPALEPLYVVNPFEEQGLAALFSTHPPTAERVSRLRAMDPEWKSGSRPRRCTKKGPSRALIRRKSAATYSPGRLPSEYHRR